jgi:nitroimidazol reductase NimA-like FMN-containing flavoprotein (pyridoxamine 5'-phosphate oxidase superfamily)
LRALTKKECLTLLEQVPVGRVGVSMGALPVILPVNFVLFEGSILIRTVAGTKLDAATRGSVVAFEADAYDPGATAGWSVLVVGRASEITDSAELERARQVALQPWGVGDRAQHYMRIAATEISGRRFASPGDGHRSAAAGQAAGGDTTG